MFYLKYKYMHAFTCAMMFLLNSSTYAVDADSVSEKIRTAITNQLQLFINKESSLQALRNGFTQNWDGTSWNIDLSTYYTKSRQTLSNFLNDLNATIPINATYTNSQKLGYLFRYLETFFVVSLVLTAAPSSSSHPEEPSVIPDTNILKTVIDGAKSINDLSNKILNYSVVSGYDSTFEDNIAGASSFSDLKSKITLDIKRRILYTMYGTPSEKTAIENSAQSVLSVHNAFIADPSTQRPPVEYIEIGASDIQQAFDNYTFYSGNWFSYNQAIESYWFNNFTNIVRTHLEGSNNGSEQYLAEYVAGNMADSLLSAAGITDPIDPQTYSSQLLAVLPAAATTPNLSTFIEQVSDATLISAYTAPYKHAIYQSAHVRTKSTTGVVKSLFFAYKNPMTSKIIIDIAEGGRTYIWNDYFTDSQGAPPDAQGLTISELFDRVYNKMENVSFLNLLDSFYDYA